MQPIKTHAHLLDLNKMPHRVRQPADSVARQRDIFQILQIPKSFRQQPQSVTIEIHFRQRHHFPELLGQSHQLILHCRKSPQFDQLAQQPRKLLQKRVVQPQGAQARQVLQYWRHGEQGVVRQVEFAQIMQDGDFFRKHLYMRVWVCVCVRVSCIVL